MNRNREIEGKNPLGTRDGQALKKLMKEKRTKNNLKDFPFLHKIK